MKTKNTNTMKTNMNTTTNPTAYAVVFDGYGNWTAFAEGVAIPDNWEIWAEGLSWAEAHEAIDATNQPLTTTNQPTKQPTRNR